MRAAPAISATPSAPIGLFEMSSCLSVLLSWSASWKKAAAALSRPVSVTMTSSSDVLNRSTPARSMSTGFDTPDESTT